MTSLALLLCGVNGFYSLATAIIGLSVIRAWIARQEKKFPHGFPVVDLESEITKVWLKDSCPKHLQGIDMFGRGGFRDGQ